MLFLRDGCTCVCLTENTPGAMDDEDMGDGRIFGAGLGVATAAVGTGPATPGKVAEEGEGVSKGGPQAKVPHFGDSLGPEEDQVDHSPRPKKGRSCTVALMDVNFFTNCEVEVDGAKAEDGLLTQIVQWRLLGYLSEGDDLEWKISNYVRILRG